MSIWQKSYTQTCLIEGRGKAGRFAALLLIFIACFLASLFFGSTRTGVLQAVSAAAAGDYDSAAYRIIAHVRLPRTLAAALAGGALAVSGVIIQAVLNNAMASPGIIGVNSGAGLAATLLIALSPAAVSALPWAAFFGGAGSLPAYLRRCRAQRGQPPYHNSCRRHCQQHTHSRDKHGQNHLS